MIEIEVSSLFNFKLNELCFYGLFKFIRIGLSLEFLFCITFEDAVLDFTDLFREDLLKLTFSFFDYMKGLKLLTTELKLSKGMV